MDTIVWRRIDPPGHEAAALRPLADGWHLAGTAVLTHEGRPALLSYDIRCDAGWRTSSAGVSGWIGDAEVALTLARDDGDRWRAGGERVPALDGCVDVDLGFSPSTNLLPIRRLGLQVGAQSPVRAVWVRFPQLSLEVLEQLYRRTGASTYHYESAGGAFQRELTVSGAGLVTRYPGIWEAEGLGGEHASVMFNS